MLSILSTRSILSDSCFGIFKFGCVTGFVKLILCSYCVSCHIWVNIINSNSGVLLHLGVSGMFGGFGWLAIGRVFGLGARFGVYEILTAVCKGKFLLIFF